MEAARAALRASRQAQALGAVEAPAPEPRAPRGTQRRPVDEDWSGVGSRPSVGSYPVDMTRVVTMDKLIPAVLERELDTRYAGRVVASVERDVYGSDGRTPVIERGSKVIGTAATVSGTGDEKVQITWTRITRPDGVAFKISGTAGDAMGRGGVLAHIDNRWGERFGKGLASSVLQAAVVALAGGGQSSTNTGGSSIGGGTTLGGTTATTLDGKALAGQVFNQSAGPLVSAYQKEQLAVPVIRVVPRGTRITIEASEDLVLRPLDTAETAQERADEAFERGRQGNARLQASDGAAQQGFGPAAPGRNPYAAQGPGGTLPPPDSAAANAGNQNNAPGAQGADPGAVTLRDALGPPPSAYEATRRAQAAPGGIDSDYRRLQGPVPTVQQSGAPGYLVQQGAPPWMR